LQVMLSAIYKEIDAYALQLVDELSDEILKHTTLLAPRRMEF